MTTPTIALKSTRGRWIVAATVLGSSLAMLDGTIVNVALPHIGSSLDAQMSGLQWVLSGYTLSLASLILLAGSLGDRLGRRRMFVIGTVWFAVASVLCALAPTIAMLIVARILQGIGAALLTPGSLAIINASIDENDRGAAIGLWSGLGGVASAIGPLIGGWLVEAVGWRAVFLLNLPLAVAVVWVALRHVPESNDPDAPAKMDYVGSALAIAGLGLLTYGLIELQPLAAIAGLVAMVFFVVVERRSPHALVPPSLFRSRVFTAANIVTLAVYAALGGVFFLLLMQLQIVAGYSPIAAGAATIPVTLLMLVLSARAGRWAQQHGPHLLMTIGPAIAALGLLLMLRIGPDASYVVDVLPGVVLFGLGLSALVAPLTAAVLGSVPVVQSGIASGVNNAIARTAQLLAVAALPPLAGLSGIGVGQPEEFSSGFRIAMLICVGLLVTGAVVAAVLIRNPSSPPPASAVTTAPRCDVTGPAIAPAPAARDGGT
ncbi:DHA2 family efflux MFS transporter permease subunit [Rhodococcus rhodnii]|uniref:Major facilitator superfamily multidrug n=2 Tax=Rhodococcus rhodnii TaxID=38312 RepID=R7WMW5_9NOCA|nr:MFS transporter [Rhodococcus rhodnii]EOM75314.1 major facilitator superfamily multidrug [Rhodococcus rhodnii LMG 5362]TXG89967.1 DHA2 family efflux MFS transporter permease subunit [Rhodococcus rhodnii]